MDPEQQQQPDKKHLLLPQQTLSQKQLQQQQRPSQQFQRQQQQIIKPQQQPLLQTQSQQNQQALQTQQLFQIQPQTQQRPQLSLTQQHSLQTQSQPQENQQSLQTQQQPLLQIQLQTQQRQQLLQTQQLKQQYQLLQTQPQSQQRQQLLQTQTQQQQLTQTQLQSQQNKQPLQAQQQQVLMQPQSIKRQQLLQTQQSHQLVQNQQPSQQQQLLSQTQQQRHQLLQPQLQPQTQQQSQQLMWRKQPNLQRILHQEQLKQQKILLGHQHKQEQTLRELLQLQDDEDNTQEEQLLVKQQQPQLIQQQQELHLQQQQRQNDEQQHQLLILQKHPQSQQQSQYVQQCIQQSQLVQSTQPQQLNDVHQIVNQPGIVQKSPFEQNQTVIQSGNVQKQQAQNSQIIQQSSTIQSQIVQQPQFVQQSQIVQNPHVQTPQQQQHQYVNVPNQQQVKKQPPFTTQQLQDQLNQLMKNKNYPQRIVVLNGSPNQQQRVIGTTNTAGQQQMQCVVVAGNSQQQSQQLQRVKVAAAGQQQQQQVQRVVVGSTGQQQSQQLQHVVVAAGQTQQQQLQQIQHTVPSTNPQQPQQIQSVVSTGSIQQQPQQMSRVLVASTSGQQQQKLTQQLQSVTQRIVIGQLKPSQQTQQLQPPTQRNLVLGQQQQRVLIGGQQQLLKLPQHQQQSPSQIVLQPQLTQQLLQPQQRVNSINQKQQQEIIQQPQHQIKQQHPQKILLQPQLAQKLLQSKSQQCFNFTQTQEGVQQLQQQMKQQLPQHVVISQQQKQQMNVKSSDQNLVSLLNVKQTNQQSHQLPTKQPQIQLLQPQLNKEPIQQHSEVIVGNLQQPVQPEPEIFEQPHQLQYPQREKLQACLLQQQRLQQHRKKQQNERLNEELHQKQEQVLLTQYRKLQEQQQQELQQYLPFDDLMLSSKNRVSYVVGSNWKKKQQDNKNSTIIHEQKKPSKFVDKTMVDDQQFQLKHNIDDQETIDEFELPSSSSDEDDDTVHKQRYLLREAYLLVQERYNALSEALGPKFQIYYDDILRNWMNGQLSRHEFDCEIRKVLYISWMFPTMTTVDNDNNSNNVSVITTRTKIDKVDPQIMTFKTISEVTSTLKEKPPPITSKRKSKATITSRTKKIIKEKENILDEDKKIKEASSIISERMPLHNAFVSSLIALLPLNLLRLERKKATAHGVSEYGYPLRLYTYADVPQIRRSSHHWYPDEPGSLSRWYWPDRLPFSPLSIKTNSTQLSKQSYRKLEQIEAADAATTAVLLRPPSYSLLPSLLSTSANIKVTAQQDRSPANITKQSKWQRIQDKKRLSTLIRMRDCHTKLLRELKVRGGELENQECWLIERLSQLQQRMSNQRQQVLAQFKIRKQALRTQLCKYIDRSWQERPEDLAKQQQLFAEAALTINDDEETDGDDDENEEEDRQDNFLKFHWNLFRLFEKNRGKQCQTNIGESLPKISNKSWRPQTTALMIRLLRGRQRFRACHKLLQSIRDERLEVSKHIDRVQKLRQIYCPCGNSDNRPCQYRIQMRRFQHKLRARELEATEVAIYRELAEKLAEREKANSENNKKLVVEKIETEKLESEKKKIVKKRVTPSRRKKAKTVKKKSNLKNKKKLSAATKSQTNDDTLEKIKLDNKTKKINTASMETEVSETLNIVNPVSMVESHHVGVNCDTICGENILPLTHLSKLDGSSVTQSMSQTKYQRSAVDVAIAAACAAQEALDASKKTRNQQNITGNAISKATVTAPVSSFMDSNDQRANELMPPPPPPPKSTTVPKKPTIGARYLLQQQLLLDRCKQLESLRREEAERQQQTYGCRIQENEYIMKEKNNQIKETGHLVPSIDGRNRKKMTNYSLYYDSSDDSSDDELFGASSANNLFPPLLHDLRIDQLPRRSNRISQMSSSKIKEASASDQKDKIGQQQTQYQSQQQKYLEGKQFPEMNKSFKENWSEGESLVINEMDKFRSTESLVSPLHEKLPTEEKEQRKLKISNNDNQLMILAEKMEITTSELCTVQQKGKVEDNLLNAQDKHNQDQQANIEPNLMESEQIIKRDIKQTNKKKSTTKRKRKRTGGRRKQRKRKIESTILLEKELSPKKKDSEVAIEVNRIQLLECKNPPTQLDKIPVDVDTKMVDGLNHPIEEIVEIRSDDSIETFNEDYNFPKLDQDHSEDEVQLESVRSHQLNSETNQLKLEYREIHKLIAQYHESMEFFPPMRRLLQILFMQHQSLRFSSSLIKEQGRFILELLPNLLLQIKQQQEEINLSVVVDNYCTDDVISGKRGVKNNQVVQNWRDLWPLYDNKSGNSNDDTKRMSQTQMLINQYYGIDKNSIQNNKRVECQQHNKTNPSKSQQNQNVLDQQLKSLKQQKQLFQKKELDEIIQPDKREQIKQNSQLLQSKQQIGKNDVHQWILNKFVISSKPYYDEFRPLRKQLLINIMNNKNPSKLLDNMEKRLQHIINNGTTTLSYYDTLAPRGALKIGSHYWWSKNCKQRWVSPLATVDMNVDKLPVVSEPISDLLQQTIPKKGIVTQSVIDKGLKLLTIFQIKKQKLVLKSILNHMITEDEKKWLINQQTRVSELKKQSVTLWDRVKVNEREQTQLLMKNYKQQQPTLLTDNQGEHHEPCPLQTGNQEHQQNALPTDSEDQQSQKHKYVFSKNDCYNQNPQPTPFSIRGRQVANIIKTPELVIASSEEKVAKEWKQLNKTHKELLNEYCSKIRQIYNIEDINNKFTSNLYDRFKKRQNSGMYPEIPCFVATMKLLNNEPQTRVDQLKLLQQLDEDVEYLKQFPNQQYRATIKPQFNIKDNLKRLFQLRNRVHDIRSQRLKRLQKSISTVNSKQQDLQNKSTRWILRRLALLMHNQQIILQRQLNRLNVQYSDNILNQQDLSGASSTYIQPSIILTPQENQTSEQKSLSYSKILPTSLEPSTLKIPSSTFSVVLSPQQPNEPKQIIVTIPNLNKLHQQESLELDKRLLLKERLKLLLAKLKPVMELWQLSLRFPEHWLHQQLDDIEQARQKELLVVDGARKQHRFRSSEFPTTTTTSQWSCKQMKLICEYLKWRQQRVNKLVNEFSVAMNQEHMVISTDTTESCNIQQSPMYSVLLKLQQPTSKLQLLTHSVLLKLPESLASNQQPLMYSTLLRLKIPSTSQQNSHIYSVLLKLLVPLEKKSIYHQFNSNRLQLQKELYPDDTNKNDNCFETTFKKRPTSPPNLINSKRLRTLISESKHTLENRNENPITNMRVQMSEKSLLTHKLIKDKPLSSVVPTLSTGSEHGLLKYKGDVLIKLNEINNEDRKRMTNMYKNNQMENKLAQNDVKMIESHTNEVDKNIRNNLSKDKSYKEINKDNMKNETFGKNMEDKNTNVLKNKPGEKTILDHNSILAVDTTITSRPTQVKVFVNKPTQVMDAVNSPISVNKLLKIAIIECSPSMAVSKEIPIKVVPEHVNPVKAILVKETIETVAIDNMNTIISKLTKAATEVALQETINQKIQTVIVDNNPVKITVPIEELETNNLMKKFQDNNNFKTKNTKNLNNLADVTNTVSELGNSVLNTTVRRYRRLIRTRTVDVQGPAVPMFHDHSFAYGTTEQAVHSRFVSTIMSMTAAQSIASYIPPCRPRIPFTCGVTKQSECVTTSISDTDTNEYNTCNNNGTVSTYSSLQLSNLIDGLEKAADCYTKSSCYNGHLWSGCARTSGSALVSTGKQIKSLVSMLQAREASTTEMNVPTVIPSQSVRRSRTKVPSVVAKPAVTTIKPTLKKSVSGSLNTISTDGTKQLVTAKRSASLAFMEESSSSSLPPTAELYKRPKSAIEVTSVDDKNLHKSPGLPNKRSARVAFSSTVLPTSTTISMADVVSMPPPLVRTLKRSKSATTTTPTLTAGTVSPSKDKIQTTAALVGSTRKLSTVKLSTPTIIPIKKSKSTSNEVFVGDNLNGPKQVKQSALDAAGNTHSSTLMAANSLSMVVEPLKRSKSAVAMTTTKSSIKPELSTSSAHVTHKPELISTGVPNNIGKSVTATDNSNNHKINDDGDTINVKTTTITEEEMRTVTVKRTRCPIVTAPMDVTADACMLVVSACEQFVRKMLMERLSKTGRGAGTLELRRRRAFEASIAVDDEIRPTPEYCQTKTIAATAAYPTPAIVENEQLYTSERQSPSRPLPFVIVDNNSKQSTALTVETAVDTQTTTTTTVTTTTINKKEYLALTKTVPATKTKSSPMMVDESLSTWKNGAVVPETMRRLIVPKTFKPFRSPTGSSARTRQIITKKQMVSVNDKTLNTTIGKSITMNVNPIMHLSSKSSTNNCLLITPSTSEQNTAIVPQTSIKSTVRPTPPTSFVINQPLKTTITTPPTRKPPQTTIANEIKDKHIPSESTTTVVVTKIQPILVPKKRAPVADMLPRESFVERGRPLVRPSFHRRQVFGTLATTCSMIAAKTTAENHATHRYFKDTDKDKKDDSWSDYLSDSKYLPPVSRLNDFLTNNFDQTVESKTNISNREDNYSILLKRSTKNDGQRCSVLGKLEHESLVANHRQRMILEVARQQQQRKHLEQEIERRVQEHQKQPPDSPEVYYEKFLQLQYGTLSEPTTPPKCHQNHITWYD